MWENRDLASALVDLPLTTDFFFTFLRKKPIFSSNLFSQLKLINLPMVWLPKLAALTFC